MHHKPRSGASIRWPQRRLLTISAIAGAGFLTLSAAACSSGTAAGGNSSGGGGSINIGVPLPLTGSDAATGLQFLAGIKYAAYVVNHDGGVAGKQINLITGDTQAEPGADVTVLTDMITRDHVSAIVGGLGSTADFAGLESIARYQPIFVLTGDTSLPIVQNFGNDSWFFHVAPWYQYSATGLVDFLNTLSPKPRTVALAAESGDYGAPAEAAEKSALEAAGYNVVAALSFTTGTPDFTPLLEKIKTAKPDVFAWVGYEDDNELMAKQASALKIGTELDIDYNGGETESDIGTSAAQGLAEIGQWTPTSAAPGAASFASGLSSVEHEAPNQASAMGYTGAISLFEAMQRAHGTQRSAVLSQLATGTFASPFGNVSYQDGDLPGIKDLHQLLLPSDGVLIWQYQGNSAPVVWPPAAAAGKIEFPAEP